MSGYQPVPSTGNLALLGGKIVFSAVSRLLTAPFRWNRWNGAPVLYRDVFYAAIRAMLYDITIAQSRYLYKNTTETYHILCENINQEPHTLELEENGARAHWIGKENADVVVLYLHGGGYTQPCTIEHMQYFYRLVTEINNRPDGTLTISVLLPAYTLAPEAQFPTQLKQSASVLSYLLEEGGRSAKNIMITGDSAGGGLAISLLSHLLHPHLDIPKLKLDMPLRGAFLYSPWVSFETTHDSFTRNALKDTLVPNMLRRWAAMYTGTANGEKDPGFVTGGNNYSEPLLANASWWKGMHNIVSDMWIWAGEDEVFVDSVRAYGAKFLEGWKAGSGVEEKVKLEFVENCAHIGPIMDVMLRYEEKGKSQLILEEWLKERLV